MPKNYRFKVIFFALAAFSISLFQLSAHARTFFGRTVQLPLQVIAPGPGKILLDFELPQNHDFVKDAPSSVYIRTKHSEILRTQQSKPAALNLSALPYSLNYTAHQGNTVLVADLKVHFCDEESKVCLSDFIRVKFPVRVEAGAAQSLNIKIPLQSKKHD